MSSSKKQWPIAPLQRAVDTALIRNKHQGIAGLAMARGATKAAAENIANAWRDGLTEGVLTLRTMDKVCIDVLGVHPIEVYGWDYFSPEYDGTRVLVPCRGCKGPKEEGNAHYCDSCRAERNKPRLCACGCGTEFAKGVKRQYVEGHRPSDVDSRRNHHRRVA